MIPSMNEPSLPCAKSLLSGLVLESTNLSKNKKDPIISPKANLDKAFHGSLSKTPMPVLYSIIPVAYLIVKQSGRPPPANVAQALLDARLFLWFLESYHLRSVTCYLGVSLLSRSCRETNYPKISRTYAASWYQFCRTPPW